MNILILGATGFIGNALFHSLVADHKITIASRKPIDGYRNWKQVDFQKQNDWEDILEGVDLLINAVGIIEGDFDKIQTQTPLEIYNVCILKRIKIIHISAIGAEKNEPLTSFLQSKKKTDDFLLNYELAKVIYPAIVIGENGRSTQFFTEVAQFPIIPLFSDKRISFIHIIQLTELVQQVITDFEAFPKQIFAISEPESLKKVFSVIKGKKAWFIKIPDFVFTSFFALFPKASIGIFNKDTFRLFQQSEAEDYQAIFPAASKHIQSDNLIPGNTFPPIVALLAISFIWIWSGVSSLVSWDESYGLMQEIGANHLMSILFIYLGSIADVFLGIAVFTKKYRKQILLLQGFTMLVYMLILTVGAPHYWLHPFGVLSKNIPLLALTYYLYRSTY